MSFSQHIAVRVNSVGSAIIANDSIINEDINSAAGIVGSKLDLSAPGVIGASTPAAGTFTTLTATAGSITGITDLLVADGGTGASSASGARTNLGLVIGTDVQAEDAGLTSIAGLTTAANKMIYTTASDTYAVEDFIPADTSWTPVVDSTGTSPDTVGYATQSGSYSRIGNMIFFQCRLVLNSFTLGSGSGNLRITGLPVSANGDSLVAASVGTLNISASAVSINARVVSGGTEIEILETLDNGAIEPSNLSDCGSSTEIVIGGFYFVA